MMDAFLALADPTRRSILQYLKMREAAAGDVAARFSQQRPAISKHLRILRESGLIAQRRHRQQRLYSIRQGGLETVSRLLSTLHDGPGAMLRPAPPPPQRTPAATSSRPTPRREVRFELDFD